MTRILVFGDTHIPFMLKKYPQFLKDVYKYYKCERAICTGDLFDSHAISRHDTHPDAMGSKEEYLRGLDQAQELYKAFPKVGICIGNHDAILYRQNATLRIPEAMLPSLRDLYKTPTKWKWADQHVIDDVLYIHGTGFSGEYPHVIAAKKTRMSTIIGHIHTALGVQYLAGPRDLIFGAAAGCGMDHRTYAAAYAKYNMKKPVVGCLVVIDGKIVIPVAMDLGCKIKQIRG